MPRLLLVADAEWVRDDVAAAASEPDTTIDFVSDPRLATGQASTHLYDTVLVDLQVGSMGGMAVTRALRDAIANGEMDPAPIVMLLDRRADVFLARRAGADAYLVKPFSHQDLQRTLATLAPSGGG